MNEGARSQTSQSPGTPSRKHSDPRPLGRCGPSSRLLADHLSRTTADRGAAAGLHLHVVGAPPRRRGGHRPRRHDRPAGAGRARRGHRLDRGRPGHALRPGHRDAARLVARARASRFDSFWTAVAAAWIAAAFGTLLAWICQRRHRRVLRRPACCGTKPGVIGDPEVDGVRVRPARRGLLPGHALGAAVGHDADPASLGRRRRARAPRVDRAAALHDAGQPAGHPDGQRRRRPGVPVVRPGARPGAGGQPPGGRRDHRGAGQHRARPARRRRGLDLQPLHRRRPERRDDDEQAGGQPRVPAYPRRCSRASCCAPTASPAASSARSPRWSANGSRPSGSRRLDVHPRVHRSWTFAGLRAFSNGLLRDLNTALVARGDDARRAQHLRRLRRLRRDRPPRGRHPDRVARRAHRASTRCSPCWRRSAQRAPRRYHFVLLSDHGQSPGRALRLPLRHRPRASSAGA